MKRFAGFFASTLAVALVLSSASAWAASTITLYSGTIIHARTISAISSAHANVGDTVKLDVVPPYPSGNPALRGAVVLGVVTQVQRAGQGRKPELDIKLRTLRLANGATADIAGKVTSAQKESSKANAVGKTALGALGGMLIGNAIGKTLFHASGGGAIGLIGGALLGANNKENFTIPQGSNVELTLKQTVTIRPQATH